MPLLYTIHTLPTNSITTTALLPVSSPLPLLLQLLLPLRLLIIHPKKFHSLTMKPTPV